MKSSLVSFVLLSVLLLPTLGVSSELRIELVGCEPDGIINKAKERLNPAKFWWEQYLELSFSVKYFWDGVGSEDGVRDVCNQQKSSDSKQRCFAHYRNIYEAEVRCLKYVKIQVHRYGEPK